MINENSATEEDRELEEHIAHRMEDVGLPVFGDKRMFKSFLKHYPEVDFSSLRIARELGFTHALVMLAAEEYLRPAGLSWSKLFILLWLRAMHEEGEQGLNPSELSERLAVTRNTVSTLLGGLERQGYITRELDPEDKRRFVIRLTPAGSEVAQKCSAPLFRRLQEVLSLMDAEQRTALVTLLTQLQQVIVQDRPDLAARCIYSPFRTLEE